MKRYGLFAVLVYTMAAVWAPFAGQAASIIWGTHEGAGARDFACRTLDGTRLPGGGPVDLANGDLIQLIKAVGGVDNPYQGSVPDPKYWSSPDYVVDDIILDEVHAGLGLGPPGAAAQGEWARMVEVDIAVGDVLYARAYSDSKSNFGMVTDIIVGRAWSGGSLVPHGHADREPRNVLLR